MRIMLYCQHVLGIGHFFRSMAIAAALDRHRVLFVEGGVPLSGFVPPSHVERAFLPPLMMDAEFRRIETAGGNPEEVRTMRRKSLMDLFKNFSPDVFIVELFPFGRKAFGFELIPILDSIRTDNLPVKVICSLRDILVEKDDQAAYESRVIRHLNAYFHLLLVHSDPALIRLDETFSRVLDIRIPVEYTGYVVRPVPEVQREWKGGKLIVAGSGGGRVGVDLMAAAIMALRELEDPMLRLQVFLGPFMEDRDREMLADIASEDYRVTLRPFSLDFLSDLAAARLSISMAGYNTCMDILRTGVKAIVYPFPQNREQALRAGKLAEIGVLEVLKTPDPLELAATMRRLLDAPSAGAAVGLDLDGARNTALAIERNIEED